MPKVLFHRRPGAAAVVTEPLAQGCAPIMESSTFSASQPAGGDHRAVGPGHVEPGVRHADAEGQRCYVESLSAGARQFPGRLDKPDVDRIEDLSPAISIEQKATSHNPGSTVGTVTEIHDGLGLLYVCACASCCPDHGVPLAAQTWGQWCTRAGPARGHTPKAISFVACGDPGRPARAVPAPATPASRGPGRGWPSRRRPGHPPAERASRGQ